jgi:hypothetical protein
MSIINEEKLKKLEEFRNSISLETTQEWSEFLQAAWALKDLVIIPADKHVEEIRKNEGFMKMLKKFNDVSKILTNSSEKTMFFFLLADFIGLSDIYLEPLLKEAEENSAFLNSTNLSDMSIENPLKNKNPIQGPTQ